MEFKDRLESYRLGLGIKTKTEMAEKLGIKRNLYSMLEGGKREPSKDVLEKLFIATGKPEEYWRFGITDDKEYIKTREDFKCLKDAIDQLSKIGLISLDKEFTDGVKEVVLAAALADITHMLEKKKLDKEGE